jgi:hypothetical protein
MAKIIHPILGAIDTSTAGCWEAEVDFGGRTVTVDLTIDDPEEPLDLEGIPQTARDLERFDRAAREAILDDAQSGNPDSAALLYLTHHHDVFSADEFQRLFGASRPEPSNTAALLGRLVLVCVGFYPEHEDARVLLDYSIDRTETQYILCVGFDPSGEPTGVEMES